MTPPSISKHFFQPADISALVYMRIVFGTILLWEVYRYSSKGWIESHYVEPSYLFYFPGFSWVKPLPSRELHLLFYGLGVVACYFIVGLFYRASAILSFLGFTYFFLLDQGRYLNHFYLVCLICFLMIFVPANRACSLDAWIWPRIRAATAPLWTLLLLRGQLWVVYFFGAIAKINADWFRGEPMRTWLGKRTDTPYIGRFFDDEWCVYFMSFSGLLIDLICVPLLLFRRTRPFGFVALTSFHLLNTRMFDIGVFPWLGITTSALFFPPDWPKRIYRDVVLSSGWPARVIPVCAFLGGYAALRFNGDVELVPMFGGALAGTLASWAFFDLFSDEAPLPAPAAPLAGGSLSGAQRATAALFVAWFVIQCGLPLRHFLIKGDVAWTNEGHKFAWRMKLHDRSGSRVRFYAVKPETGERWELDVKNMIGQRAYTYMRGRPHLIQQMAAHLAKRMDEEGYGPVEIRVEAEVSLNRRKRQLIIDPEVDLARVPFTWGHAPWILPMNEATATEASDFEE